MAVVLTIMFTKAGYFSEVNDYFLIPAATFILIEVAALLPALLVIMPTTKGRLLSPEIENMPNPFFFGFFTRFSEDNYLEYLSGRLKADDSARYFLARDLYQTGCVAGKKYKLLKYAYTLAVTGVVLLAASLVGYLLI